MITITVASVPDREQLVAELWDEDVQFGELSQEEGQLVLEIYPRPDGLPWTFPFEDIQKALERVKGKLLEN